MTTALDSALVKSRRHIVTLLFLGYMFSVLDRGAISFAALQMNAALGFTATAFGWATAAFYVGYLALEVPSNLMLKRVGARFWLARIMLTWGAVTGLTAFVGSVDQFVVLRFLLGVSEAGFLPGVIFFLTTWFPAAHRARTIADFTLSIPIVSAIGAVLSSFLLGITALGLQGWQWLFIIEAVPPILLSFVLLRRLPDTPRTARFLSEVEKQALETTLASERMIATPHAAAPIRGLLDRDVWLLGLTNLGFILAMYTVTFWFPQMVKGFGFTTFQTGFVVAMPQVAGALAIYLWGRSRHSAAPEPLSLVLPLAIAATLMLTTSIGLASGGALLPILALTVATAAIYVAIPAFWSIVTRMMQGARSAGAIAFVNTIGSLSGVIGPPMVGWIKDRTHSLSGGFAASTGFLVFAIIMTTILHRTRHNSPHRVVRIDC